METRLRRYIRKPRRAPAARFGTLLIAYDWTAKGPFTEELQQEVLIQPLKNRQGIPEEGRLLGW